jgi:hypothetical protein
MNAARFRDSAEACVSSALCAQCGMPLDARYFDESRVAPAPAPGSVEVLAQFELPPQYCGVLEYFSQFTDAHTKDNSKIETPGVVWTILVNNRPLDPYRELTHIVNPWGYGSFPVRVRLDDSATVEFIARGVDGGIAPSVATPEINKVGGRIMGRYWYNPAYGDVG